MIPAPRPLTWAERQVITVMRKLTLASEGYISLFDEELIRTFGIRGFFRFAMETLKAFKRIEKSYGEPTTQLLAAYASLWNGCGHCSYGHLYALNLAYFKETGQLYPLSEHDLLNKLALTDDEILEWIRQSLADPKFARDRVLLERFFVLRAGTGEEKPEPDDSILRLAASLYNYVNECSIVAEPPAPPYSKIAKQGELIARYKVARLGLHAPPAAPPPQS